MLHPIEIAQAITSTMNLSLLEFQSFFIQSNVDENGLFIYSSFVKVFDSAFLIYLLDWEELAHREL